MQSSKYFKGSWFVGHVEKEGSKENGNCIRLCYNFVNLVSNKINNVLKMIKVKKKNTFLFYRSNFSRFKIHHQIVIMMGNLPMNVCMHIY